MKSLKQYILESLCEIDRNNFAENCPEFYSAVSQFCRDKTYEDGIIEVANNIETYVDGKIDDAVKEATDAADRAN